MTPKAFKHWRKGVMHMSQKEAAEALGLKRRVVQYYEKGERDGERLDIPKAVRLACYALAQGVTDYHGPDADPEPPDTASTPDDTSGGKPRKKKTDKPNKALDKGAKIRADGVDAPPLNPDTPSERETTSEQEPLQVGATDIGRLPETAESTVGPTVSPTVSGELSSSGGAPVSPSAPVAPPASLPA